jgi:hypothetical protein
MRRRLAILGVVAVLGAVGTAVGTGSASGSTSPVFNAAQARKHAHFERLTLPKGLRPRVTPGFLRRDRVITATVLLDGPSVAEQVAAERDAGRSVSKEQKSDRRATIARAQNATSAAAQALGLTVLYEMQDAVNALVVMGKASVIERLSSLPGVVSVQPSRRITRDNGNSNAFTGVPAAWEDLGITGVGQTIAVIDTGIDYRHADFGGSGVASDFTNDDPTVIEPGSFPTAKVVGGYDFVGDAYDASSDVVDALIPHPDPDPIDCYGHGSHVAGTAAGFGVNTNGSTYTGPYTAAAVSGLAIAPGAAPQANLLAYKVFGCDGSVDDAIVTAAINRAVRDGATVINMSLGSDYGSIARIEERAINHASRAGVLVVASAGNAGASPYLVGSPSTADRALSVAAVDAKPSFPAATISLTPAGTVSAQNSNDSSSLPITADLVVLSDGAGGIGLGCDPDTIPGPLGGKILVVLRGDCGRVEKALNGQAKGAGAVIMVNSSSAFPPFEGPVTELTIPFLGVSGDDAAALLAANATSATISSSGSLANPFFGLAADFTSGGPRLGDSAFKPDVSAPGVSVYSVAVGTGSGGEYNSGTSMASPHAAGVAALVRSAHPTWTVGQVKAAIMNTATLDTFGSFSSRVSGTGVISARAAVSVPAVAQTEDGTNALSFGYRPEDKKFSAERHFTIQNLSDSPVEYGLVPQLTGTAGFGISVSISPTHVTVLPGERRDVKVRLSLSREALAALPSVSFFDIGDSALLSLQGFVLAEPVEFDAPSGDRPSVGLGTLRMPWFLVPRGESRVEVGELRKVDVRKPGAGTWSAKISNKGVHDGYTDLFAWQLSDRQGDAPREVDVVSVGLQSYDYPTDELAVFAVNFSGRRSTAASKELDILLDTNDDGEPEFALLTLDYGYVTSGYPDGTVAAFLLDLGSGELVAAYGVDAPMNGSVVEVPVFASDLGMSAGSPVLRYSVDSYDLLGDGWDSVSGAGRWDLWSPPVPTGGGIIPAGASGTVTFSGIDSRATKAFGVKGYLFITVDDPNGTEQADRVKLPR